MIYNEVFDITLTCEEQYGIEELLKLYSPGELIHWRLPLEGEGFLYYLKTFHILENGYGFEIADATIADMLNCGPNHQWGTFTQGIATPISQTYAETSDTIAACIICQNSEASIEQCLESLKGWADEILVLDGGSADQTIRIAENYTEKVFHSPWPGNYSVQRNILIDKISSDWMLMIDSDEYVGVDFSKHIRCVITYASLNGFDLIWLPRYWLFQNDRHGIEAACVKGHWLFWPDPQARLARMSKGPFYSGAIHETLKMNCDGTSLILCFPEIALHHLKLRLHDYHQRRQSVARMNRSDCGGAHVIQLLPEDCLSKLMIKNVGG